MFPYMDERGDEVTGAGKKQHSEDLHSLSSSADVTTDGQVQDDGMGAALRKRAGNEEAHNILVGKPAVLNTQAQTGR